MMKKTRNEIKKTSYLNRFFILKYGFVQHIFDFLSLF